MAPTSLLNSIEKLKGRGNYETWKFVTKAYEESEKLWDSVDGTTTEEDETKKMVADILAKSRLILLLDPLNFSHIQSATTAKEVWDNLTKAFDDSGLSRRVGLLRQLISTRVDNCNSMEEYVIRIVTTAHKLKNAKMDINNEWIGTLLLAGLSDDFNPMIMAIESSETKISSDVVKRYPKGKYTRR